MKKLLLGLGFSFMFIMTVNAATIEPAPACPWGCGGPWTISEDICDSAFFDHMEKRIGGGCSWGHSVYCLASNVAVDGAYPYKGVRTGIGWTGYWKALTDYCEAKGIWTNISQNIHYGWGSTLSFTVREGETEYSGKLLEQTSNRITIKGIKSKPTSIVNISPYNSPYIYLQNPPQGKINISINSEFGKYQNQKPAFNQSAGWKVESDGKDISVENQKVKNLFYELALKKVELSRNGKNFTSQENLKNFLEHSEFFKKLGFNKTEKQNSLNYVLPKLPKAKNYYLTILENPEQVTQLDVTPKAQIIQKYFVIYPTTIPVKTFGGLVYPEKNIQTDAFTVKNYGEIIVKPEMFVIWK